MSNTTSTTRSSNRSVHFRRFFGVVTALVGIAIVWLFFGDQTPPPPVPTTTGP